MAKIDVTKKFEEVVNELSDEDFVSMVTISEIMEKFFYDDTKLALLRKMYKEEIIVRDFHKMLTDGLIDPMDTFYQCDDCGGWFDQASDLDEDEHCKDCMTGDAGD